MAAKNQYVKGTVPHGFVTGDVGSLTPNVRVRDDLSSSGYQVLLLDLVSVPDPKGVVLDFNTSAMEGFGSEDVQVLVEAV